MTTTQLEFPVAKPLTQAEQILLHLQAGYALTPLEALRLFSCLRLGARISDLKALGHRIETTMVKTDSGKHVASYTLAR